MICSVYAVKAVRLKNINEYCGIKYAGKCSASPVPLYTCVNITCVVAVGKHE